MVKNEIINYFLHSKIMTEWHYFQYHFNYYLNGSIHPFADSIVRLVMDIEDKLPGAGRDYIKKIENINGREKFEPHYDQLLQVLSEMLIVHRTLTFDWNVSRSFAYEPKAGNSNMNPELVVNTKAFSLGVEVKAPEFLKKHTERANRKFQLPTRSDFRNTFDKEEIMLPRDNVIKDFLLSANSKFKSFKEEVPNFYGILVIVWDDFVYEPISALLNVQAGLFTENSFALDTNGNLVKYENIDAVVITRHLINIVHGTREEPLPYPVKHALGYGRKEEFPFKIIIKNPFINTVIPEEVIDCYQAYENWEELGSEYGSIDLIEWIN